MISLMSYLTIFHVISWYFIFVRFMPVFPRHPSALTSCPRDHRGRTLEGHLQNLALHKRSQQITTVDSRQYCPQKKTCDCLWLLRSLLLFRRRKREERQDQEGRRIDRTDRTSILVGWFEDFWRWLSHFLQVFSADVSLEMQSKHVLICFVFLRTWQIFVGAVRVSQILETDTWKLPALQFWERHVLQQFANMSSTHIHSYMFILYHICSYMTINDHIRHNMTKLKLYMLDHAGRV